MSIRAVLLLLVLLISGCQQSPQPSGLDLGAALGGSAQSGFARAIEPRQFLFPQDHAAHPEYRNEWWYVTGNLEDESGRRFGYQVTLFRIALSPTQVISNSAWASNQVWMAHVALTDVDADVHLHEQRLARGAAGLAGQSVEPFRVWLEDWQIIGGARGEFPWMIDIKTNQFSLRLKLTPQKPVVLQGDRGLSQKSAEAGNASYYYSLTRLNTTGVITTRDRRFEVGGQSWLDREWSTSALADDQAGWDWFSLQLNDNQELMVYRLRKKTGEVDAHSAGTWVLPDGNTELLSADDVVLQPLRFWTSDSGRRYPISWDMRIPSRQRHFIVDALLDDQEMKTGIFYWEGAVTVMDAASSKISGYGYLEMTGY